MNKKKIMRSSTASTVKIDGALRGIKDSVDLYVAVNSNQLQQLLVVEQQ